MLRLASGLQSLGHQVVVGSSSFDASTDLPQRYSGIEWRYLTEGPPVYPEGRRGRLAWFWQDMAKVGRLLGDVDAVNAHEWPALHAGAMVSRKRSVPLVWTRNDPTLFEVQFGIQAYGVDTEEAPRLRRFLRGLINAGDFRDARTAEAITVLDSQSAAVVERIYRRRAHVVRSGPAPQFFAGPARDVARKRLGMAVDSTLLLAVGIMFRHRAHEDFIDAMAQLRGDAPMSAWIVGSDALIPSYADSLEARIQCAGVQDTVRLIRRGVSEDELIDMYAAADVFVHTPAWQTYGLAPLEALACRTPVVLSSGAGVHEILTGRSGVQVVPPRQPAAIAAAVLETLDSARQTDLEATRTWMRTELNDERYAQKMLHLLEGAHRDGA